MATEDARDRERSRTPTESALVLLAIYVALYLGVAGLIHILTLPHAIAAVAPSGSVAPATNLPVGTPEPSAKTRTDPATESTDDPHECNPRKPFDSNCTYYD